MLRESTAQRASHGYLSCASACAHIIRGASGTEINVQMLKWCQRSLLSARQEVRCTSAWSPAYFLLFGGKQILHVHTM